MITIGLLMLDITRIMIMIFDKAIIRASNRSLHSRCHQPLTTQDQNHQKMTLTTQIHYQQEQKIHIQSQTISALGVHSSILTYPRQLGTLNANVAVSLHIITIAVVFMTR